MKTTAGAGKQGGGKAHPCTAITGPRKGKGEGEPFPELKIPEQAYGVNAQDRSAASTSETPFLAASNNRSVLQGAFVLAQRKIQAQAAQAAREHVEEVVPATPESSVTVTAEVGGAGDTSSSAQLTAMDEDDSLETESEAFCAGELVYVCGDSIDGRCGSVIAQVQLMGDGKFCFHRMVLNHLQYLY
jgi:hypothetical protein